MPRRRRGDRAELGDHLDKPVDAVHRLDHDRQLCQLVAPHVLSSSASWRPSTQMRLALATCARCGAPGDRAAVGQPRLRSQERVAHERHRPAVDEEPARLVAELPGRVAWRSRSVTASAVIATMSPQKPEARSSTTSPRRARRPSGTAADRAAVRTRRGCRGSPADRTSEPACRSEHLVDGRRRRCGGTGRAARPSRRASPRPAEGTASPTRGPGAPGRRARARPRSARCARRCRRACS